ncbi:type VI secretion system-associated FHA domain protein TagH [Vibrio pectenicida]|uniref:Type VI secretion system-associated FHA domain protein TagH n=1 Tax=Vibrio pectenicida TaxID=62763 RepID=A0A7Y4A1N0_9VIBR|nr:type VI secretion system-associated FHA domain protein TagH [Vibrio pectenicida]NOH72459.1 type VI secretion system-associated FHA domain protein TagH [Vibrio pectenicida]
MLERLVIVISKHPEEYTGAKFVELPDSGGSIGRNPGCSVPLIDHNRYISSTHCLVSIYGDAYYISDVSTNGLIINGNKLLKNQPIPIHEGDTITLGQYELSISVERETDTLDIACDITPDRDNKDPLLNLEEIEFELKQEGPLEEIFIETQSEETDLSDPMTHLDFSLKKDDNHLIRTEDHASERVAAVDESTRQLVDDSLSVFSEFDAPSLIPEDWMSGEETRTIEVVTPKESALDIKAEQSSRQLKPSVERSVQEWEEMASSHETHQVNENEIKATSEKGGVIDAFRKGLGITDNSLLEEDPRLFEQMGMCLRLCMTRLQYELVEIEELKQSPAATDTDLISLMLDLNKQSMLSPNELVEQMLDEISEHKSLYEQALNNYVQQSISQYDPIVFEQKHENKGFLIKQKLWDSYKLHYLESLKGVHGIGTKKLVQENYNRLLKEKHA